MSTSLLRTRLHYLASQFALATAGATVLAMDGAPGPADARQPAPAGWR